MVISNLISWIRVSTNYYILLKIYFHSKGLINTVINSSYSNFKQFILDEVFHSSEINSLLEKYKAFDTEYFNDNEQITPHQS